MKLTLFSLSCNNFNLAFRCFFYFAADTIVWITLEKTKTQNKHVKHI